MTTASTATEPADWLGFLAQFSSWPGGAGESQPAARMCPVCCEGVAEEKLCNMGGCSCCACEGCVRRWIDTQLLGCRNNKMLRIACIGCTKMMPQKLVLTMSPAAAVLARQLDYRMSLQANKLYPWCMQVECQRAECVGIGFLGFEAFRCFVFASGELRRVDGRACRSTSRKGTDRRWRYLINLVIVIIRALVIIAQFSTPAQKIMFRAQRAGSLGHCQGTGTGKADCVRWAKQD